MWMRVAVLLKIFQLDESIQRIDPETVPMMTAAVRES